MIILELLSNFDIKAFHSSVVFVPEKVTAVEQIFIETEWTDYLQNLIDFGNKNYLRNFSLGLQIDDNKQGDSRHIAYQKAEVGY